MAEQTVNGSCLCGEVRFAFRLPSKFVAHCHCSICRRAHGAPFVTWVGTWEDRFEIIAGEPSLRSFASSPEATRQFCGECGSPMFFRSSRWEGEVHISRALIDEPLDREPAVHVFYSDHAQWLDLSKKLPAYGGDSGTEQLSEEV